MDIPMTRIEMANAIWKKNGYTDEDEVDCIFDWLDDAEYTRSQIDELAHEYARKVWYESGMNDWRDYPEYQPKDPTPLPSILDLKDKRK